jgi:hypothetical protein
VIPVLVDGATPPRQELRPAELRKLARLNAHELSHGRYESEADRLLEVIQRVLATTPDAGPVPASSSWTGTRAHVMRVLIDAEHAAQSIPNEYSKVFALADVARALLSRSRGSRP